MDFLSEATEVRRKCHIFQELKEMNCQPIILYACEILCRTQATIKMFSNEEKLREILTIRPTLHIRSILMVMELFYVYTCDKITQNYIHTHTRTQMSTCNTGEIRVSSVDCTNANFLVLTLHSSYTTCNYWEKLGEGYAGPPCTFFATSCGSIIIFF